MRHVRSILITLGCAGVVALLAFLSYRASVEAAHRKAIAEQKEANAAIVEGVYRYSRELHTKDSIRVAQMARALKNAQTIAERVVASTDSTMATVRGDTSDADSLVWRARLSLAVASYDSLASAFHAYLRADTEAHRVFEVERESLYRLLTLADSTIDVWKVSSEAWKRVSVCEIRLLIADVPCPNRRTVLVVGGLAGLYAGWRLTR